MESTAKPQVLIITKVTPRYWRATFNDPPMNLMTPEIYEGLWTLLNELERDQEVQVIVFDSSATDYFIMHVDLVNGSKALRVPEKSWALFVQRLAQMPVVSICMIRGRVRGIGSEFALSCDMRFASVEKAIWGQPEVGSGVVPGGGCLEWLPRLVGRSRALEICLGSDDFDAKTAELYNWINRALPDSELDGFVDALARRIASFPKFPVAQTKAIINNRAGIPSPAGIRQTQDAFMQCRSIPEVQQRIQKLFEAGLQEHGDFEFNLGRNLALVDTYKKNTGQEG
ncbi:ClpP/crotonase-like domain-containing protein [Talaromyces proteolyticus]|uniref:ClpP/crotonase-like domain-containing protein n=1 Tax=Talaromyces proteolyticus TaxID=1131652 RepID=A0AAD4KX04_9EURO|nr:ClpP/crotonase-like domain-containing protein [Talaromyces proteolyticus]KAH8698763.1 ClpP/crotonase-like domain-containing protein [Talaromyces proteolyticus]